MSISVSTVSTKNQLAYVVRVKGYTPLLSDTSRSTAEFVDNLVGKILNFIETSNLNASSKDMIEGVKKYKVKGDYIKNNKINTCFLYKLNSNYIIKLEQEKKKKVKNLIFLAVSAFIKEKHKQDIKEKIKKEGIILNQSGNEKFTSHMKDFGQRIIRGLTKHWDKGVSIEDIFNRYIIADKRDNFYTYIEDCAFIHGRPVSLPAEYHGSCLVKDKELEIEEKLIDRENKRKNKQISSQLTVTMQEIGVFAQQTIYSEKALAMLVIEAAAKKKKKPRNMLSSEDIRSINLKPLRKKKKKRNNSKKQIGNNQNDVNRPLQTGVSSEWQQCHEIINRLNSRNKYLRNKKVYSRVLRWRNDPFNIQKNDQQYRDLNKSKFFDQIMFHNMLDICNICTEPFLKEKYTFPYLYAQHKEKEERMAMIAQISYSGYVDTGYIMVAKNIETNKFYHAMFQAGPNQAIVPKLAEQVLESIAKSQVKHHKEMREKLHIDKSDSNCEWIQVGDTCAYSFDEESLKIYLEYGKLKITIFPFNIG